MDDRHIEPDGGTSASKNATRRDYYPAEIGPAYYNVGDGQYSGSDEDRSTLNTYLRALIYRKWIVLAVFVTVVGIGVANTWNLKSSYVSEATVEVQKLVPSASNLNDVFAFFGQFDVYFQTQVMALRDRKTAEKFLERTHALPVAGDTDKPTSKGAEKSSSVAQTSVDRERAKSALINSVLARLKVDTIQGTQLIRVQMTADQPQVAQRMLTDYLDTFVALDREKRSEFADGLRTMLRKELDEAELQLQKSERDLQEFTAKHGLITLDKGLDQTTTFLDKAGANYMKSREKRLQLEEMDRAKDAAALSQTSEQYIQNLRTQLATLKSEYSSMQALYSPDYFKVVLLKSKIHSLETTLSELEKTNLASMLDAAKKAETMAGETYEKVKQDALEKSPLASQYEILKKIMEANGQMYVALLQKYKQATLDQGLMGHRVAIFSPPTLPMFALRGSRAKVIILAVVLGLIGGVAVALGLDKLDSTVRTTDELEKTLKAPLLGVVPKTESPKSLEETHLRDNKLEFMPFLLPISQLADAIRVVESTTEALLEQDSSATICISSALPLEGKTFISVAMATVMASENKRVLVIDGDMRRPRIQKLFEDSSEGPGLSDLISGSCANLGSAIRKSHVPGLCYLPAGSSTVNPVALLKSDKMSLVLEQCREIFDVVILDAPPLMGMADATILSRHADGLVLVTRQGHTPVEALRRAQESIQMGRVRLLGVVLNMVYRESGHYDYYTSKYSDRYHRRRSA